ncbi:MAG: ankyrin repeat domain-containing protein, partial [Methanosarcinaceae archaeon]|nr:ankyrin repeat domain-containing protein [Methanosarcinaceae archaeon]
MKYGRDTYGPKHTPLFVDGLNIHTREPVKWIDPDGTRWILSNFASQQTLMRTLDGLSTITGDPKYKQAAMDATRYVFDNLRAPNGLIYWGHSLAYDAGEDVVRTSDEDGSRWHGLKFDYPHYQIMWDVDSKATKKFIEAYWSAHILDWSILDMERASKISQDLEEPWEHEYQEIPAFSKGTGIAFLSTGTSLIHAAVFLHKQSGQESPLVWSERLTKRYIDTRHSNTGISANTYNKTPPLPINDLQEHLKDPRTVLFPYDIRKANVFYYPERTHSYPWIALLLTDQMVNSKEKIFTPWVLEELTAWGKVAYREQSNAFIPMLTDGTSLEGYVIKKDNVLGPEGTVMQLYPADWSFFWAYSLAYRGTGDEFMWKMARSIASGHGVGNIGENPESTSGLKAMTSCSDTYGLLGFLELYTTTHHREYLKMAERIGDNILKTRYHKGFFVPSEKHTFSRFDCSEPLALLHLEAALRSGSNLVPRVWPSCPLFFGRFRHRDKGIDRSVIYRTTESSEPPLSLPEAAAMGDAQLVTSLIKQGHDINERDDPIFRTALHRAVIGKHVEIVKLLLANGANANSKDQWPGLTPLHHAVEDGSTEIVKLLLNGGADINSRRDYPASDTSLHTAVRGGEKNLVELLISNGANVNARDGSGKTPLWYAKEEGYADIVEILRKNGAMEKTVVNKPTSLLFDAVRSGDIDQARKQIANGADINAKDATGRMPVHYAV